MRLLLKKKIILKRMFSEEFKPQELVILEEPLPDGEDLTPGEGEVKIVTDLGNSLELKVASPTPRY